jgi:outer membrane protein assembly factor BamB
VYALNAANGDKLWTLPLASKAEIRSEVVMDGDTGYFGASDQNVYAVTLSNGQLKWKTPDKALAGPIYTSPTLVDGILYIPAQGNNIYALNAADGSRKWCFDAGNHQACAN